MRGLAVFVLVWVGLIGALPTLTETFPVVVPVLPWLPPLVMVAGVVYAVQMYRAEGRR